MILNDRVEFYQVLFPHIRFRCCGSYCGIGSLGICHPIYCIKCHNEREQYFALQLCAMWSRLRFTRRLVSMSRKTRVPKPVLPPGVYLHIASPSSQSAQQPFDITSHPLYDKYAEKLKHLQE